MTLTAQITESKSGTFTAVVGSFHKDGEFQVVSGFNTNREFASRAAVEKSVAKFIAKRSAR